MKIVTINERFEDTPVDVVILAGERWLPGPHIAAALGFADPSDAAKKMFQRNRTEFDDSTTILVQVPTAGGHQLTRLYNARGSALFAMKANTPKGEAFRRWVLDVLEGKAEADAAPVQAGELTAGVKGSLTEMFLGARGNTHLVKYRNMGLGPAEIGRLLGVRPQSISHRLRVAEFLGLCERPADIGAYTSKPSFLKMVEGRNRRQAEYKKRYREKQAALPAPTGGETHDA